MPSLITDEGPLKETPAILLYIAQKFPDADLAALDSPFALARAQEFNSYLCSTVHVAHAHKSRGKCWADDPSSIAEMTRKVPETVLAAFQLTEDGMLQAPWVLGEQFSICDSYLYTVAHWQEGDSIDQKAQLPRVAEHRDRVAGRPGAKKALAEHFD